MNLLKIASFLLVAAVLSGCATVYRVPLNGGEAYVKTYRKIEKVDIQIHKDGSITVRLDGVSNPINDAVGAAIRTQADLLRATQLGDDPR